MKRFALALIAAVLLAIGALIVNQAKPGPSTGTYQQPARTDPGIRDLKLR